jgi:hypothetical protein
MRSELPIPAVKLGHNAPAVHTASFRFVAAITNPEMIAIIRFSTIGLLATVYFVHLFPNLIEAIAQFP